ncbi:MAG: GspE/PulE family protein [Deltaproteobacteria bacterium]|nr:GspE/PulE family protein [Deltaproteobacteria bacterium]MBW2154362.1 GspE/PulE family protein [Deltaproteobacteria bacterium]
MLNKIEHQGYGEAEVQDLKSEVIYRKKLQEIGNKINAAKNLDEILITLKDHILSLFEADRITIYVVDGKRRELVSRFKSGDEIAEIRVPISTSSVAGCSAFKQKLLNIKNVYDQGELAAIDPDLKFDSSWDKKTGFITRQVLVAPITFQNFLLGALQLINRKDGTAFTEMDEQSIRELADILGIALYNQRRMARARPTKFDYLLKQSLLTKKELDKAIAASRAQKEPIEEILIRDLKISKKDIGRSLSDFYRVPFVEYDPKAQIPGQLLVGLKVPFLRKNTWVPLREENGKIVIAIDNPDDLQRIDMIKSLFARKPLTFVVALKKDIQDFIRLFTHDEKAMAEIDEILSQLQEEAEEIEDAEASVGEEDSAVVQLVNKIILDAYERGASDIHIEPYPGKEPTRVRIRVDGACQVYQTIPYNYRNAVASRIKIMCDLDIAERRKPQDGKIRFRKYGGKDIELRVATVPTQGGVEDIVMRILHTGEPIPLDKIGFSKKNYENFLTCITQPYGIIFVCGPTGSGKTTTLHSALSYINKPETKIWTAEDPVEITQKGLRQVQVRPKIGFDFAAAMRSFLRADPDVIMVGEMRDKETTQIGIEASLTGHLVFSTLHTNSAPESITRLLDMGMDPFNFADAVLCILAQRLVRTLCKDCKQAYHPSKEEYEELVREYGRESFHKNLNIPYSKDLTLFKPNGCQICGNTGYRGRMGIHELLMGTDEIKRLIQSSARMEEIREQAIKDGMTTLKQDGIEKILAGYCDLIQVRKVCIR